MDTERFRPAAHLTVAAVVIGGVIRGMPAIDILICALVAGGGVALVCAVAAWLFDVPLGPSWTELRDDFDQLRRLRFRGSAPRPRSTRPARGGAPAPR